MRGENTPKNMPKGMRTRALSKTMNTRYLRKLDNESLNRLSSNGDYGATAEERRREKKRKSK